MPEFAVILIHIIHCHDCKANALMEQRLNAYTHFADNDERFATNALESLKKGISELSSQIHANDLEFARF